ncbi:MAG TPA: hypothetical protein VKP69_33590 [Isosphaeraceae bacterium]|nr:hypothetical protein [Isosphaeraceae bacterium]
MLAQRTGSTERLPRLLFDWFDRTTASPVRFSNPILPIEQRSLPPDTAAVQVSVPPADVQGAGTTPRRCWGRGRPPFCRVGKVWDDGEPGD